MSIIVRGMEMPTSCTECPCCRHDNWNGETAHQCNVLFITFGAEDENWIYNTRPNWCPLIEIPPHGDLVDRDALIAEYDHQHKGPAGGARQIMVNTKAVIEAEGET